MSKIKAVLFDCDGVLVESEKYLSKEIHNWLTENNETYHMSFEEFYKMTRGQAFKSTISQFKDLGIELGDDFFKVAKDIYITKYKDVAIKMENVEEVLNNLSHLPKAVCSNNIVSVYSEVLENYGIKHYFDDFFGIDNVKNVKPAPDMFLQAAENLNVPIENCLIIDDSYLSGVPAGFACNAGAVVGFLSDEFADAQQMFKAGADYIIRDLTELPVIIDKLNS